MHKTRGGPKSGRGMQESSSRSSCQVSVLGVCYDCGGSDHWSRECPRWEFIFQILLTPSIPQARMIGPSHICRDLGHRSKGYPQHRTTEGYVLLGQSHRLMARSVRGGAQSDFGSASVV